MVSAETGQKLYSLIRDVKDFPKKGIVFRDITLLLNDHEGLKLAGEAMAEPFRDKKIDVVVGAESRGFVFGVLLARELECGFVRPYSPQNFHHGRRDLRCRRSHS